MHLPSLTNQKAKLGFYFHIPFCPHICPYCDFTKTAQFSRKEVNSYFSAIEKQCDYFLEKLLRTRPSFCLVNLSRGARSDVDISPKGVHERRATTDQIHQTEAITVYFGGGTPSLFPSSFYLSILEKLKRYFHIEEATIETNPHTNMEKNFHDYYAAGFERVTLGAQSLCPKTLKTLGRKHTPEMILKNIDWAKRGGFKNIQVDLIYGLKKGLRTIAVDDEIERICAAGASGISAYALTLEKRTLFAYSHLDDENNAADEYSLILKKCQSLGLRQSETSHFSFYESKHNNIYWYGYPYIGIGTGAHGLLPATKEHPYGVRYKIGETSRSHAPGNDVLIFSQEEEKEKNFRVLYENSRTEQEYKDEMFFTLLRTEKGIPFNWLKENFKEKNILDLLLQDGKIKRALAEGKIILNSDFISLSPEEKIRGDAWTAEFVKISS